MCKDEFRKLWDSVNGFTLKEAQKRKAKIDEKYGVDTPDSKWQPAKVVLDLDKRNGYKIVICTKE